MNNYFTSTIKHFVSDRELPLNVVYRSAGQHPPRLFHDHYYNEIAIIISGSAEHIVDDRHLSISAGDVLLLKPGPVHAYDKTGDMEIINLIYDPERLSLPLLDSCDLPLSHLFLMSEQDERDQVKPLLHLVPEELASVLHLLRQLETELHSCKPGRKFYIMALFMQIMIYLSRIGSYQNSTQRISFQIGDAISYMNKHFAEVVEVEKLAKTANMSLRNFQRHFKSTTGCTPVEFMIRIRLRNSAVQLVNSDEPIYSVALGCGFYDSNYFCKKFKECFGITPKNFRMRNRKTLM